jgi:hypothetical protein
MRIIAQYQPTSILPLRLNISFKVWLHKGKPLLDAALNIPATLLDIPEDYKMDQ